MNVFQKIRSFFAKPGGNFLFLGAIWGVAAIPCLCPACVAGPAVVIGRGIIEKVPFLKRLIN